MGRFIQVVYKGKVGSGQTAITNNIEKLAESMYIYIVKLGQNQIVKKFIKN